MEWYRYNPDTLEYEHPVICQPNPAKPGDFLIPPSATPKEPPNAGDKQVALFDPHAEQWSIQPGYRGTEYWLPDGTHHKIETIGETPPDNALYEQPPDLKVIYQINGYAREQRIQREQQARIKAEALALKQQVEQLSTLVINEV